MKTILFIEDEAALQKTFGDLLSREEYKMISALDGEIGIQLAKLHKPDLVILDLILPKLNGFDVLKRLKDDQGTKDIPVIVLTNLEGVEDIDKVLALGATTYLVKANYSLEEVLDRVKKALGE